MEMRWNRGVLQVLFWGRFLHGYFAPVEICTEYMEYSTVHTSQWLKKLISNQCFCGLVRIQHVLALGYRILRSGESGAGLFRRFAEAYIAICPATITRPDARRAIMIISPRGYLKH